MNFPFFTILRSLLKFIFAYAVPTMSLRPFPTSSVSYRNGAFSFVSKSLDPFHRSGKTVLINNRSGSLKAYWFAMSAFNYSSEHIHYDMHLFCIWTGDSQPSVELIWISLELFNHAKAPCIASQCLPTSPVVDKLASIQLTRQIYNSKFVNMFSETFGVFGCKFSITGDSWKCNCVFIWPSF